MVLFSLFETLKYKSGPRLRRRDVVMRGTEKADICILTSFKAASYAFFFNRTKKIKKKKAHRF